MKLIEISSKKDWEAFQTAQPFAQFLQSWSWGEFRSKEAPIRRFAAVDADGTWLAAIQMERRNRRFGMGYWFAPRGPVFVHGLSEERQAALMPKLRDELMKRSDLRARSLFWRFEPVIDADAVISSPFRPAPALNPATTIVLDLTKQLDELQKAMHEKTRYNIRVAERNGVVCRSAESDADVDAFLDLMDETAARDKFVQHSRSYLKATYESLKSFGMAKIRLAEHDGKVLAANFEIIYGDTVTYLYGASSSSKRNVMAPYLLHWTAITEAKADGFTLYDWWGANPESTESPWYKPSWDGITRFKRGWGGRTVDFVGTWDIPLNPFLYNLVFARRFIRR